MITWKGGFWILPEYPKYFSVFVDFYFLRTIILWQDFEDLKFQYCQNKPISLRREVIFIKNILAKLVSW